MKKLLTLMAAILMAVTMKAQSPMILGENHAMLRIEDYKSSQTNGKYLLLPVQEKEENANIAVLDGSNEMVKRLNVRLAVDKVDYYVPLETKNVQLLDITFHGDKRTTGAVKDFACWKEMKYSDTFDTTNRDRGCFHQAPQSPFRGPDQDQA